jgi:hypothetical protein
MQERKEEWKSPQKKDEEARQVLNQMEAQKREKEMEKISYLQVESIVMDSSLVEKKEIAKSCNLFP